MQMKSLDLFKKNEGSTFAICARSNYNNHIIRVQIEVTRMENAAVANVLRGEGYRYCHTNLAEAGIYYKYYQEGFHIVMAVNLSGGNRFSVQQYRSMEEHAMDLFYHPQGRLGDFPDGFPVYHVEMLTLLIGGDSEVERKVCAECRNVWVYQPRSGRLLIYENQPGRLFRTQGALEQGAGTGGAEEMSRQGTGGWWLGRDVAAGCRSRWLGRTSWQGTGAAYASAQNTAKNRLGILWKNIRAEYVTIALVVANVITYLVLEWLRRYDERILYGGARRDVPGFYPDQP